MKTLAVHYSRSSDAWTTPRELFHQLDLEFGFELDAAANAGNALCSEYYGPDEDALSCEWLKGGDGAVFLNPPYSKLREFLAKAKEQSAERTVVCLIPARTDTKAWHQNVWDATEVRFIRGRLRFGGATASAPFPSAIVIFTPLGGPPRFRPMSRP